MLSPERLMQECPRMCLVQIIGKLQKCEPGPALLEGIASQDTDREKPELQEPCLSKRACSGLAVCGWWECVGHREIILQALCLGESLRPVSDPLLHSQDDQF